MKKIKRLKEILKKEKIDGYIVPKNDEFHGEYTPAYNDRLNYISNFSGSFGFALILKNKNYLFVDGRYTLQASKQSGKSFNIVTIPDKLPKNILKNKKLTIGFDPKLLTKKTLDIFFSNNSCKFKPFKNNLIDNIWRRKRIEAKNKFYSLPNNAVGQDYKSKIKKIISYLQKYKADYQFITASENNAWLLNIRGGDAEYSPIPYSYILIDKNKKINFFCDHKKLSPKIKKKLKNVNFFELEFVNNFLSKIYDKKFIIDRNTCSYFYEKIIERNNKILKFEDPIYLLKSIKHRNEINNVKKAHIYDGAALTKYLFWVKKNFYKKKLTEISASKKLYNFRKQNKKFKYLSFPTISGTGPNGAIVHYKASEKSNRQLRKGDIYLVDSGGQYNYGTTDVTRTISLGNSNKRIKDIFTRVLKGHIAVSNYKLNNNTSGSIIDKEARKYLKMVGLDYAHGTGHGVGYFLNVHEGPHAISKNNKIKFHEGMIVSNEPGYYEENKFGIRIENLIYVKSVKGKKYFENLTVAPIDKDLINQNLLSLHEKKWLNNYHNKVFNDLKKYMRKNEISELKKACLAI